MSNPDLNESFLTVLKEQFPKQTMLITVVEDILKIERESAYRRIKGVVQFSIREMGILAQHLNISLDNLLINDQSNVVHIKILRPRTEECLGYMAKGIKHYLDKIKIIENSPCSEMGIAYSNIPIEFYTPYGSLFKFICFRWGNYYIGTGKHKDFANWKLPDAIIEQHTIAMKLYSKIKKIIYIWDKSIIWSLMKDLKYFASAGIIEEDDVARIKRDLHSMLNDLERLIGDEGSENESDKIEFYISHVKIGMTYTYLWSEEYTASYITGLLIHSNINEDKDACRNVKQWIKSMRKVSTLISGTGDKERILFFKEQHQIVDSI